MAMYTFYIIYHLYNPENLSNKNNIVFIFLILKLLFKKDPVINFEKGQK